MEEGGAVAESRSPEEDFLHYGTQPAEVAATRPSMTGRRDAAPRSAMGGPVVLGPFSNFRGTIGFQLLRRGRCRGAMDYPARPRNYPSSKSHSARAAFRSCSGCSPVEKGISWPPVRAS